MDLPPGVTGAASAAVRVARAQGPISCAALVGSWASDRGTAASDVDLVVLVEHPERLLDSDGWCSTFAEGATLIRQGDFGAVQERRLRLPDGLVVEVAVGNLSWASTTPVDPGTRRVAQHGLRALLDPEQRLAHLLSVVRRGAQVPLPSGAPAVGAALGPCGGASPADIVGPTCSRRRHTASPSGGC